jgi:thiol-disulfide isomerase/thioredoxin
MLIFWSIFCEPCRAEMPMIQGTFEKYKDQGLEVLAVALDGDLVENIKQFAKQGGYTFRILLDEEDDEGSLVVAENFMVPGTPTIYVVDTKGKVVFSKVGRVDEVVLHKAIEGALGK